MPSVCSWTVCDGCWRIRHVTTVFGGRIAKSARSSERQGGYTPHQNQLIHCTRQSQGACVLAMSKCYQMISLRGHCPNYNQFMYIVNVCESPPNRPQRPGPDIAQRESPGASRAFAYSSFTFAVYATSSSLSTLELAAQTPAQGHISVKQEPSGLICAR